MSGHRFFGFVEDVNSFNYVSGFRFHYLYQWEKFDKLDFCHFAPKAKNSILYSYHAWSWLTAGGVLKIRYYGTCSLPNPEMTPVTTGTVHSSRLVKISLLLHVGAVPARAHHSIPAGAVCKPPYTYPP